MPAWRGQILRTSRVVDFEAGDGKPGIQRHRGTAQPVLRHPMPGRSFSGPVDFNAQLAAWLQVANARTARTIRARPVDWTDADRAAMLPLPPISPEVGWREHVRLDAGTIASASMPATPRSTVRDRSHARGHRRSGPGPDPAGRPPGRRPRAGLGPRPHRHRPHLPGIGAAAARAALPTVQRHPCGPQQRSGSGPGRLRPRLRAAPRQRRGRLVPSRAPPSRSNRSTTSQRC